MLNSKYDLNNMMDYFIDKKLSHGRSCPHCQNTQIVLYGRYNGKQRYKCKDCKKTFTSFTNTPFIGTHYPNKWPSFMQCTLMGMSLQASAEELQVSYVTLFYWRHKLLNALDNIEPKEFVGTVELNHVFLNYSRKGERHLPEGYNKDRVHGKSLSCYNINSDKVGVLTALDGFENVFSRAVCQGHLCSRHIKKALGKLLTESNTVCSNTKHIFMSFVKSISLKKSVEASEIMGSAFKYINKCIHWMLRFNGVATKYLNNYLSWYNFLKSIRFDESCSGIRSMIDAISSVNIKNTCMSIGRDTPCLN